MHNGFNPLVPRPIDQPTDVPMQADADLSVLDDVKIFVPPSDRAQWPAWRAQIEKWRTQAAERLNYSPAMYNRPEATWAASCFTVAQVWLWDELLYDAEALRFTPEKLLADATERLGGFDGVVLWHAYPVIGIDDRNQWDYYRQVPGLKDLVDYFHAHGVKVFVDYNPWDTQTRRTGDDVPELAALIREFEADGIFLDTMKEANPQFVAALEEARPGIALEGESKLPLTRVTDHSLSWAQWFADSPVPGVLRAHWFERKHMQHHIRRWNRDHSEELQSAWINGVGLMTWEIVFGVWVGWNERDAATLRRMLPTSRGFSSVLLEGEWMPLAPLAARAYDAQVFASRFHTPETTLWTAVNRGTTDYTGPLLGQDAHAQDNADNSANQPDWSEDLWYDLATGTQLDGPTSDVTIPAHSIGGVLRVTAGQETYARTVLDPVQKVQWTNNAQFQHRRAHRINNQPHPAEQAAVSSENIPAHVVVTAGEYTLTVEHRMRETGMYQGAPYVNEWKPLPPRLHDIRTLERDVTVAQPLAVASTEVTNAQFHAFLQGTGYTPRTTQRFLDHWDKSNASTPYGAPQPGTESQPVTYVLLDDAHAYCTWSGGVLPTEDEWQLAAQTARAAGDGTFQRLTPAVWNLTNSEHSDGRSRFMFLKGGMDYLITDSDWYFDGGVRAPEFSAKYLIPGFGMARSANIGFRCAWTLASEPSQATTNSAGLKETP